jgi:spore cortex formation protein SpoVR/YcgB (stage V sporulation)
LHRAAKELVARIERLWGHNIMLDEAADRRARFAKASAS